MAFYMNPAKRFSDSITLTTAPVKTPKNTREALFIHKAYPNGISRLKMARELYFMTGATHSQTYHM